jgi:hypothetical protein
MNLFTHVLSTATLSHTVSLHLSPITNKIIQYVNHISLLHFRPRGAPALQRPHIALLLVLE